MNAQMRQGDVFLRPASTVAGRRLDGPVVLAYGEVTGHAHQVVADPADVGETPPAALFEDPDGARYLLVERPCLLVHEEHGPIHLAPGAYHVIRQREYSPEAVRNVSD